MSCYHPMVGYYLPNSTDDELRQWRKDWFKKRNQELKDLGLKPLKNHGDFVLIPHEAVEYFERLNIGNLVDVPCGKCIGCLLDKSVDWANRCTMEAVSHDENYFITFTYDDDHLPLSEQGFPSLKKEDFESLIKTIRNYWYTKYKHDGIRFFGCGEYGSTTSRPHYHICFFNLPIKDLTEDFIYTGEDGSLQRSKKLDSFGCPYYDSSIIRDLWGKGHITIAKVNWNTAAYCAKYTTKKIGRIDSSLYTSLGIQAEFIRMSTHPGIGYGFFENHIDYIVENDNLIISTQNGAKKIPIPRYFDKLICKNDEKLFKSIKESRKIRSVNKRLSRMMADSRSFKASRQAEEDLTIARFNIHKRDKV